MKITIKFIKRVFKTTLVWLNPIIPYPGTVLYENLVNRGVIKNKLDFYMCFDDSINMTSLNRYAFSYLKSYIYSFNSLWQEKFVGKRTIFKNINMHEITAIACCPFCDSENHYYFNLNEAGIIAFGNRILVLCNNCRQRFFLERIRGNNISILLDKLLILYPKYIEQILLFNYYTYLLSLPVFKILRLIRNKFR